MSEMSFDGKASGSYWGLELVECYVSAPRRKTHPIEIPGGDGYIDVMKGIGRPVYDMRALTALFKVGSRNTSDAVQRLLNELEGREVPIVTPDNPNYYWVGDIHVQGAGIRSGSAVTISATVFPWRYARQEVVHNIPASAADVTYTWYNSGARPAVPELTISGDAVKITVGERVIELPAGSYDLSELEIPGEGSLAVKISGGAMIARYREAIL